MSRTIRPLCDRFERKVDRFGECHLWIGYTMPNGYGQILVYEDGRPRMRLAHRVAWELTNGSIPADMQVLHHCDVRNCVRNDYLFLGTQLANVQDMLEKQRQGYTGMPGERHHKAKLKQADLSLIREMGAGGIRHADIAARFGVARSTISRILRGDGWIGL